MFNTAFRIVGSHEDAEDVLQESFVSAFKNLHRYRGDASFGAWLKRIVINKAITHLRRNRYEFIAVEGESDEIYTGDELGDYPLSVEQIRMAVNELPTGFRSVLTLYLFEGYDHQEISEILGITESTSKTQYKRAKEKLKSILKTVVKYE